MFELRTFIEDCRAALREPQPSRTIELLLKQAIADPEGIRAALAESSRARDLSDKAVFRSKDLTILDAALPPGIRSPAHDHQMWAVIGVFDGEEQNYLFRTTADGLEEIGRPLLKAGDVAVLGTQAIHAIENPLDRLSHAIHVYGGDFFDLTGRGLWDPKSQVREPYDMQKLMQYSAELSRK